MLNSVPCNGSIFKVNNKVIAIEDFSKDVIYNLNWIDQIVTNDQSGIFFKEYLECLVVSSNIGDDVATGNLKIYLSEIALLLPKFSRNDFLGLDVFIVDVINKVDNNELLEFIIPFAKITENPDILFPTSCSSIQKYGVTVINGIIKKQNIEI